MHTLLCSEANLRHIPPPGVLHKVLQYCIARVWRAAREWTSVNIHKHLCTCYKEGPTNPAKIPQLWLKGMGPDEWRCVRASTLLSVQTSLGIRGRLFTARDYNLFQSSTCGFHSVVLFPNLESGCGHRSFFSQ